MFGRMTRRLIMGALLCIFALGAMSCLIVVPDDHDRHGRRDRGYGYGHHDNRHDHHGDRRH